MNIINIDGLIRKVASEWNELSKSDLMWLMNRMEHLLKPSYEFRLRMMLRLLNVQWWRIFTQKKLMNIPVEEASYLSNIVDWAFPAEKVSLTKNHFRTKWVLFRKMIGPADGLKNLTLAEFSFADFHFRQYMSTQDENELNKLCAVLWRVKGNKLDVNDVGFRNDKRSIFNSYAINENSKRYKWTSKKYKYFVLMFFWGCRNHFVKTYPSVFSSGNASKSTGLDLGWVNVMFELSGSKFGTLDETSKQDLTTILLFLENSLLNQKTTTNE